MQVDYAVELSRDDESLDFPWAVEQLRYYDLKHDPGLIENIEEVRDYPELRDFLLAINNSASTLQSAKCDVWSTTDIHPEEEIFNSTWKFGSYVDLVFTSPDARFSFEAHENFLKKVTALLRHVPDIPASADFLLRRCRYHDSGAIREGFYVTFYAFGFGEDEAKARLQWGIALQLVTTAVSQLSHSSRGIQNEVAAERNPKGTTG